MANTDSLGHPLIIAYVSVSIIPLTKFGRCIVAIQLQFYKNRIVWANKEYLCWRYNIKNSWSLIHYKKRMSLQTYENHKQEAEILAKKRLSSNVTSGLSFIVTHAFLSWNGFSLWNKWHYLHKKNSLLADQVL